MSQDYPPPHSPDQAASRLASTGDDVDVRESGDLETTTVQTLSAHDGESAEGPPTRERGGITRIGRFVVLERLGSGAMGVIYAAYDPGLDCRIAVKLLKPQSKSREARELRLVREAQSLAKLSHPNVVHVYEVGMHEGQVFVAMEFLHGSTLTAWLRSDRSLPEILDVFMQAGRGLEAAHRAGIVHRDFKPDNVFIDAEGRVRVLDFGLARADDRALRSSTNDSGEVVERANGDEHDTFVAMHHGHDAAAASPDLDEHKRHAETRRDDGDLTATGAFMGTPAYMSPEQFSGQTADVRSDQFSFCVTLWEALYGQRPFAGRNLIALSQAVRGGRTRAPSAEADVPAWVHRVVARGLAVEADDRWPDMGALLSSLARNPARRKRRVALGVLGVLGVVLAGVLSFSMGQRSGETQECRATDATLDSLWNEDARNDLAASLSATGVGYADETHERVTRGLDAYSEEWSRQWLDACEATHARGEQSEHLFDLRMACLDTRRTAVRAFLQELASADATAVEHATHALAELPSLDACSDRTALLAAVPAPDDPDLAKRVAAIRVQIASARTVGVLGRYREALAQLRALEDEARAADYPPVLVELWLTSVEFEQELGEQETAEANAVRAYELAMSINDQEAAARAAARAAHVVGYLRNRSDAGLVWARVAESLAARRGRDTPLYADARAATASIHFRAASYEQAYAAAIEAKSIRDTRLSAGDPDHARILNDLSAITYSMGRRDEAIELQRQAIALRERIHGPNHPELVPSLQNLAVMLGGTREESKPLHERAYAISRAAHGDDHGSVAIQLCALARFDRLDGDLDAADEKLNHALEVFSSPDELDRSIALTYAGQVDEEREDCPAALAHFDEARRVVEMGVGGDHPRMLHPLMGLGRCTIETQPQRALEYFQRASTIAERHHSPARTLAEIHEGSARAQLRLGHRGRARELGTAARDAYAEAGAENERARVEGWLAAL